MPVSDIDIPEHVSSYASEYGFALKPEFHITLLSFQNGKKLKQTELSFDQVTSLIDAYSWDFSFLPEYYVLERTIPAFVLGGVVETPEHTRRSIIQRLQIPDFQDLFDKLSQMAGVHLDIPFAHITLYSWSDFPPEMNQGIAVNSEEDFKRLVKGSIPI